MKVSELKKKYKNQWVLAEVLKENKLNQLVEVKPILISSDRDEVYAALAKVKRGSHMATIFTGKIPPEGIAFAFYGSIKL
jgi:hypothetical protein